VISAVQLKRPKVVRSIEQAAVRQSFSYGRTKPVVVVKIKRRAAPADGKQSRATAAKNAMSNELLPEPTGALTKCSRLRALVSDRSGRCGCSRRTRWNSSCVENCVAHSLVKWGWSLVSLWVCRVSLLINLVYGWVEGYFASVDSEFVHLASQ
jgi:hypothetical protein